MALIWKRYSLQNWESKFMPEKFYESDPGGQSYLTFKALIYSHFL